MIPNNLYALVALNRYLTMKDKNKFLYEPDESINLLETLNDEFLNGWDDDSPETIEYKKSSTHLKHLIFQAVIGWTLLIVLITKVLS